VEVILPTGNYYGRKLDQNEHKEGLIENVKYEHLGFINHPRNLIGKLADNFFGVILPLMYLFKKGRRNEFDLIICYNIRVLTALMLLFLKIILKMKVVLILPEFYERPTTKTFLGNFLKWYSFYFSMQHLIKYFDGFIVLSHYLKKFVNDTLSWKKPIMIMPNLIDPERFERYNIEPFRKGKTTIGYVGTPTRKDGVIDLIRSFSQLNKKYLDTHLLIIGDLTNGKTLIPHLQALANDLNVTKDITFTGLVSHNKVPDLLQSCQILALTRPRGVSAEAGFPTKLGEYFACKKPVVITAVGDMARYFTNEKHVMLVEAENINSITQGFEKLLEDKELREKMPCNAYNWMENSLDYKKMAYNICKFLDNI